MWGGCLVLIAYKISRLQLNFAEAIEMVMNQDAEKELGGERNGRMFCKLYY